MQNAPPLVQVIRCARRCTGYWEVVSRSQIRVGYKALITDGLFFLFFQSFVLVHEADALIWFFLNGVSVLDDVMDDLFWNIWF